MHQIIFLTLYLGLVTGRQGLKLQADPGVKTIVLQLDGKEIERIEEPPWQATIDFGRELVPHELVAIGLDEDDDEIVRASQPINVPRPAAEIEIVLQRDSDGTPVKATLKWRHVEYAAPARTKLKLDNAALRVDKNFTARLPPSNMKKPHLLEAEIRFRDGIVARRELVYGGEFAESMPAQLTPVAVKVTSPSEAQPSEGCFGNLRAKIDNPGAEVLIVKTPKPRSSVGYKLELKRQVGKLDRETSVQVLWPVAHKAEGDGGKGFVFSSTRPLEAARGGLFWMIMTIRSVEYDPDAPIRWADAVAVAGVQAVANGRRRAVILVLGEEKDESLHTPEVVRKYLASIGVPLFVFSFAGPRPDAAAWGDIYDVSTIPGLDEAAHKINETLAAQRIAWLNTDPLTALRAQVLPRCGYTMLASRVNP